jgi:hypothetical protein
MFALLAERVETAEVGDGFQVIFNGGAVDYFLIQRHFEEPDDGSCYIESGEGKLQGHFVTQGASLSKQELLLHFPEPHGSVRISFSATARFDFHRLKRALKAMIPSLASAPDRQTQ